MEAVRESPCHSLRRPTRLDNIEGDEGQVTAGFTKGIAALESSDVKPGFIVLFKVDSSEVPLNLFRWQGLGHCN